MSVKSFNQQRSSFTPYQSCIQEKELSLFSRLNLNDQNSLEHPMRNFAQRQSSDLFSMRSKKRKRSAELQLKESVPGNRTYLNVSLVGKSSLVHNDLFGKDRYHDVASGGEYDDESNKQFSQKSCPVGPSNSFVEQQSYFNEEEERIKSRQIDVQQNRPRFHKTKNMLRTISSYLHKFILHNKRSTSMKERYFKKVLMKKYEKEENDEKLSLLIFEKININEDESGHGEVMSRSQVKKNRKLSLQKSNSQQILPNSRIHPPCSPQLQPKAQSPQNQRWKLLITQLQLQQKIKQFHEWVQNLSVINFVDYEEVWTDDHEFTPLYRQLCYRYYKEEVVCDVMRSRLTTKEITVRFMNQFLEGLFCPKLFYRFK